MDESDSDVKHQIIELIPRLRRFGMSLTGNAHDSDDLVQNTIERALKNLHGWERGTRLDSWMFRIAQNIWIDQCRASKRRGTSGSIEELHDLSGEDGRSISENQLMVRSTEQAISALPEDQRSIVSLVLVEGMAYREAADILGIPVGTVMSRLARARKALVEKLQLGGDA